MGFGKPTGPTTSDMLTEDERKKRIQEMKAHQAAAMGIGVTETFPKKESTKEPDLSFDENAPVLKTEEAEEKKVETSTPPVQVKGSIAPKKPGRKKGSKKPADEKENLERVNKCIRIDTLTDMRLDLYCRKKSTGGQKVTPGDLVAMLLEEDLRKNDPELLELSKQWIEM